MRATTWDTEWAAEKASAALRYLGDFYPECAASEALHSHQDAAHEAAVNGDVRPTWRPSEATCGPDGMRP